MIAVEKVGKHITCWHSDAKYTVRGSSPLHIHRMQQGRNGDVWCSLSSALARAQNQQLSATKVRAHQTLAEVVQGQLNFGDYFGNVCADVPASVAADLHQQQQQVTLEFVQRSFALCVLMNLRLAAMQAHAWHAAARLEVPVPTFPPMPLLSDLHASQEVATFKLRRSNHQLRRRGDKLYCDMC